MYHAKVFGEKCGLWQPKWAEQCRIVIWRNTSHFEVKYIDKNCHRNSLYVPLFSIKYRVKRCIMLSYLLKNVDFDSQNDSRIVHQPRSMPLFERTNTRHTLGHGILLTEKPATVWTYQTIFRNTDPNIYNIDSVVLSSKHRPKKRIQLTYLPIFINLKLDKSLNTTRLILAAKVHIFQQTP